jgi:hypothetical protein
MVGPIKMSAEPHVYEKQHFVASRRGKSKTVVEPCSTVHVNSFFFFFEKQGEKFSFFFLKNQCS